MLQNTTRLEGTNYTVRVTDGVIQDGEYSINSVVVENGSEDMALSYSFEEPIHQSELENAILGAVIHEMIEQEDEQVNTCDNSWNEPRFVSEGTNGADILVAITELAPCTTSAIEDHIGLDHDASGYVSTLKKKGLVACVGYSSRAQILVPTHVGMKEVYTIQGLPDEDELRGMGAGLDGLFDSPEDEDE